jgi:hypothetical protein
LNIITELQETQEIQESTPESISPSVTPIITNINTDTDLTTPPNLATAEKLLVEQGKTAQQGPPQETKIASETPPTEKLATEKVLTGRVISAQSGFFTIETRAGKITCQISGKLKNEAQRANKRAGVSRSDLVALNDVVTLERDGDETGTIIKVAERQHVLSRVSRESTAGTSAEAEQIIIANTDQAIFVFSAANPAANPRAIDRFLVCAERAEIPSIVLCINKIDLIPKKEAKKLFGIYGKIGYQVVYVSALTGEGLDSLKKLLTGDPNRVSVFTGPSGVGKCKRALNWKLVR